MADEHGEPPATFSDFYEAFRPLTPTEKAALIWRMPSPSHVVVSNERSD